MCPNDSSHRLLLFFPKFLCYIFAISQVDDKDTLVNNVSFPVILKNIYDKFQAILIQDDSNPEWKMLKKTLLSGLLLTSKTNTKLRWMFIVGESEGNYLTYKQDMEEFVL